jgi:hypothetical protein
MLYKAIARARLDTGADGQRLNDSKALPDRAAELAGQSGRNGFRVVIGGREKKRQCSDQT